MPSPSTWSRRCGHDRLAVDPHRLLLVVVLEVDGELVDADRLELLELGDVLLGRAEDAEPVDDLVGHEVGVVVVGLAVRVVVVAGAALDVVGERLREPSLPPCLAVLARRCRRCGCRPCRRTSGICSRMWSTRSSPPTYAGAATQNVSASGSRPAFVGGVAHLRDHPLRDVDVGELQDEPVADLAGGLERERAVGRDPHLERGACAPTGTAGSSRCARPAGSCPARGSRGSPRGPP